MDNTIRSLVRQGKLPDFNYEAESSKMLFYRHTEEDKCLTTITQLIKERIPKRFAISNHHDMQILTPMRRGPFGTEHSTHTYKNHSTLNKVAGKTLYPISLGR